MKSPLVFPPLCKKTLSKHHSQSTEGIKQTNSFHVILFIISYVNLEVTQFTKAFAMLSLVLKIYECLSIRSFLLDLQYWVKCRMTSANCSIINSGTASNISSQQATTYKQFQVWGATITSGCWMHALVNFNAKQNT